MELIWTLTIFSNDKYVTAYVVGSFDIGSRHALTYARHVVDFEPSTRHLKALSDEALLRKFYGEMGYRYELKQTSIIR